ncbi:transposase [Phocaeicola dorei]|uniref:transposase n=1 Tax=Phocaeicola dorei TaxID=357276 RepID=UPI0039B415C8
MYLFSRLQKCKGCPLKHRYHRSRSERIVQVNHQLRKIKEKERKKLLSPQELKYRRQRPQNVEAVFSNPKKNKHLLFKEGSQKLKS